MNAWVLIVILVAAVAGIVVTMVLAIRKDRARQVESEALDRVLKAAWDRPHAHQDHQGPTPDRG